MKKTRLRQLFEVVRYSGEKEELEEELSAVEKVINEAKINKESIDHLFFVGGSTLMKKEREIVIETTEK